MQRIIAKADYELYEELFVNGNLEKTKELWEQISKNVALLNGAIQIVEYNGEKMFQAPMICFMMLKYFYTIPEDFYQTLINEIFLNPNLVCSIITGDGSRIDYLSLILENPNYKLSSLQKNIILSLTLQNYDIFDNSISIKYHQIPKIKSPIEAKYSFGNFEITVSQYESVCFKKGQIMSLERNKVPKNIYDYRHAITKNPNFTASEKNKVFNNIISSAREFKSFVNYQINELYLRFIKHGELSLEELKILPLEEITFRVNNGQELTKELARIRQMMQSQVSDSPKL